MRSCRCSSLPSAGTKKPSGQPREINWLGDLDSNQDSRSQSPARCVDDTNEFCKPQSIGHQQKQSVTSKLQTEISASCSAAVFDIAYHTPGGWEGAERR